MIEKQGESIARGITQKEAKERHHKLKHRKRSDGEKSLIAKYDAETQQSKRLSEIEKDNV